MNKPLDLQKELADEELKPFSVRPGAVSFSYSTPARGFTHVVVPMDPPDWYFVLSARTDCFDERLAKQICFWAMKHEEEVDPTRPIQLVKEFYSDTALFDTLVILNCKVHGLFQVQSKKLHRRSLGVFPAYECEFSGKETISEIDALRNDIVPTLDWKRQKCPQIRMRFRNMLTGGGTSGKRDIFAKSELLQSVVKELPDDGNSFVEIENVWAVRCVLRKRNNEYLIQDMDGVPIAEIGANKIGTWLDDFVRKSS